MADSGSPIIIGGDGSVGIGFDDQHYRPTAADEYSNANDEIGTLLIVDRHGRLIANARDSVRGKDCTIKIVSKDASGDSPITIESKPRGPLKIKFQAADYPFDAAKGVFYSATRKLSTLSIKDNASGAIDNPKFDSTSKIVVIDR